MAESMTQKDCLPAPWPPRLSNPSNVIVLKLTDKAWETGQDAGLGNERVLPTLHPPVSIFSIAFLRFSRIAYFLMSPP